MKLLFDCVGTMATAFYNHTTLFYNQTASPLLFFDVNGASEGNAIPVTERQRTIASRWSSLMSKYTIFFFDAILAVTTQITTAKQTKLVIYSSKRKGTMLYKWYLELQFYRDCSV